MNDIPKISAPATRAITGFGITMLEQFNKYTEDEIMQLHGMGPKAMGILKQALKEKELSFKQQ